MSDPITVTIERNDALLIGATLRILARNAPAVHDPVIAAQLERVGSQLTAAANTGEPKDGDEP